MNTIFIHSIFLLLYRDDPNLVNKTVDKLVQICNRVQDLPGIDGKPPLGEIFSVELDHIVENLKVECFPELQERVLKTRIGPPPAYKNPKNWDKVRPVLIRTAKHLLQTVPTILESAKNPPKYKVGKLPKYTPREGHYPLQSAITA